ncbi:hypothetical protein [Vibrio owensii]|uniref:hypothetical protein n=1 Tax=Vibrio owensii TaxID=696485 RepID=UPI0018F1CFDA|nr:hypothetical protein [Vibrio owensii]
MKVKSLITALAFTASTTLTADALAFEQCKEEAHRLETSEAYIELIKTVSSEQDYTAKAYTDEAYPKAWQVHQELLKQYGKCVRDANKAKAQ